MTADTDTSSLTQEAILEHLNDELGMPTSCPSHPQAKMVTTFFEKGVPVFVTMTCGDRLVVRQELGEGRHRYHRE